jgi:alanine racemase
MKNRIRVFRILLLTPMENSSSSRTLGTIAEYLGKALTSGHERSIRHLLIDSRRLVDPANTLFFALVGERHDGHNFISDLYERGVRTFVVSKAPVTELPEAVFIQVENTQSALQMVAARWRAQFDYPVVGITGSNGKTIVKEWLFQLLDPDRSVVRSPKSYNSQVGVPLSVWEMDSSHDIALIEAGISQPGEMIHLQKIIKPEIGLFTNLGTAHDEHFTDQHQKAREKLDLFQSVEVLVYCADHEVLKNEIAEFPFEGTRFFTWSRRQKADLQIGKVEVRNESTDLQAVYARDFIRISIPFTDEASIENAIHCWAIMLHLGYSNDEIVPRMAELVPVAMRLELKQGINDCSVINDSYNSDLQSIRIALDFLNQQQQHPVRTVILSDILQSGRTDDELYDEVAKMLVDNKVDRLIGVGGSISAMAEKFKSNSTFYLNTESFLDQYDPELFHNETILLKGARTFGFEAISRLLQQKTHQTVLEIELGAMVHNLNFFRSKLESGTKIMAMVKAFSYGSGTFEIANMLQYHRVDYLAVAFVDEGVELRKAGISVPIMVMNPEEQSYDVMIRYRLEPEVYSQRVLTLLQAAIQRQKGALTEPLPIHIKLNTGMNRLGFSENDLPELIMRLKNNPLVQVASVFSHLASSESMMQDGFTHSQIEAFTKMHRTIQSQFTHPINRHILNSSGILRFPEAQLEMVRLGIGLYGVSSEPRFKENLLPVSSLKSHISQIHHLKPGDTVGYGRLEKVNTNMTTATIPVGYADGLGREHGNRVGKMMVNEMAAPIIGNVCMDMCMIDITGIPAEEGEEVIVFGAGYSLEEFAVNADEITYEVLTGISTRVKRVYYQE